VTTVAHPLDAPALGRLWETARRARERRGAEGDAHITLERVSAAEARELDWLLAPVRRRGVHPRDDVRISLSRLAEAVAAAGDDLYAVLERHGGPLADRPAEARRARAAAQRVWEEIQRHPALAGRPELRDWIERARASGALGAPGRDAQARRRLVFALDVVAALTRPESVEGPALSAGGGDALAQRPAGSRERVERSALSAELAGGDPHALDSGRPAELLVRGMLAHMEGVDERRLDPLRARELWAAFGVECDPAAATVLTLGLRARGRSPLARALRAQIGGHFVLTYGQLRTQRPRFRHSVVHLCENPSVVTGAERELGSACPPLVCLGGWPNAAVQLLCERLRAGGAELCYHGDFDWDGLAIAAHARERLGAVPWRFDAAEYRRVAARRSDLHPLGARPARVPDGELADALQEVGRVVPEELVLEELIADLRNA
jgi:uncharacterized protein (TIGR02679 family)